MYSIIITLDRLPVHYAPRLSLNNIYEFSNRIALQNNSSLLIFTHTHALYKPIGCVIIPKPHFSSSESINSRCCRFDVLLFTGLAQHVAAMTVAVLAGRWRSIDHDQG